MQNSIIDPTHVKFDGECLTCLTAGLETIDSIGLVRQLAIQNYSGEIPDRSEWRLCSQCNQRNSWRTCSVCCKVVCTARLCAVYTQPDKNGDQELLCADCVHAESREIELDRLDDIHE